MFLFLFFSVRKLVVEISPEGFVVSKRSFKTLPELIRWFKKNAQSLGKTMSSSGRKVRCALGGYLQWESVVEHRHTNPSRQWY